MSTYKLNGNWTAKDISGENGSFSKALTVTKDITTSQNLTANQNITAGNTSGTGYNITVKNKSRQLSIFTDGTDSGIKTGDISALTIDTTGNVTLPQQLTVSGATALNGGLTTKTLSATTGTFSSNVDISGTTTIKKDLTVGNTAETSEFKITAQSSGKSMYMYASNSAIGLKTGSNSIQTFDASGNTTVNKDLTVSGAATFNGKATFKNAEFSSISTSGTIKITSTTDGMEAPYFKSTSSPYLRLKSNGLYVGSSGGTSALTVDSSGNISMSGTLTASGTIKSNNYVQAPYFYATSDKRLKTDITPYISDKSISDIPLVKFKYKNDPTNEYVGFIAQDLQKDFPELVVENTDGYLGIKESKLVYYLVAEIKSLKTEINDLKKAFVESMS